MNTISATQPDWAREKVIRGRYEPAKYLLASIRRYQQLKTRGGITSKLMLPLTVLFHRFWSAVSGADIPLDSKIGGGMMMPHPNGIVIHPDAEIGPNCLFFQQVTIGTGPIPGTPVIHGHVDIGAGARVLGGVKIGAHAKVGANAVVIGDIPEHATAVGIPARVIRQGQEA
ncbi:MAG: serine acetyltransferase [Chlorobiaceae bacterium]|nr:serine acetyltransferase [Chlorobiaceae bacterium]NTV60845.1 serine acetyltransferase [Chlorobiaceae bacterium]